MMRAGRGPQGHLVRVRDRIKDKRVLALVKASLKAGVLTAHRLG